MISESDIQKLCRGRIVYVEVINSFENHFPGPHYAVMIDEDDAIRTEIERARPQFYVSPISSNDKIESVFVVPAFPRLLLTGHFICNWLPQVDLNAILKVGPKLTPAEMGNVAEMINRYQRSKASKKSTQS